MNQRIDNQGRLEPHTLPVNRVPDLLPRAEHVEHDGAEPDGAVAEGPVVAEVLAVHGGASIFAGDDVGQGPVRAEEEAEGHGLGAERPPGGRLVSGGDRKRAR